MGWRRRPTASRSHVHLEPAVDGQVAPVRVVTTEDFRSLVVLLGADGLGDERVPTVRADDDVGELGDGVAAFAVAANPGDASVLDDDVFDGELLANFGARFRRRVDEQLVEHGTPGAVRDRRIVGAGSARDREGAEVERVGVDRRTSRRGQPIEQTPSLQCRSSGRVEDMGRQRVAREGRTINDENPVALPGEQHPRRGARAPCTDHDGVVSVLGHGSTSESSARQDRLQPRKAQP